MLNLRLDTLNVIVTISSPDVTSCILSDLPQTFIDHSIQVFHLHQGFVLDWTLEELLKTICFDAILILKTCLIIKMREELVSYLIWESRVYLLLQAFHDFRISCHIVGQKHESRGSCLVTSHQQDWYLRNDLMFIETFQEWGRSKESRHSFECIFVYLGVHG